MLGRASVSVRSQTLSTAMTKQTDCGSGCMFRFSYRQHRIIASSRTTESLLESSRYYVVGGVVSVVPVSGSDAVGSRDASSSVSAASIGGKIGIFAR